MKFLFDEAVESKNPSYKFSCKLEVSKGIDGLILQNEVFKTHEDYLLGLNRFLMCMGISQYQYEILESKPTEKDSLKLQFYFAKDIDKLQFLAIMSADRIGHYTRSIPSVTPAQSLIREYNVIKFLEANELKGRIRRQSANDFEYVAESLFAYLAVSTHFLKGEFDTKPTQIIHYPTKSLG